jgi:ferredoxin
MPYVVTEDCILCGACVVGCENNAITEGETRAFIDIDICIECGTCERNCPSGAIIFVDEAEAARIISEAGNRNSSPS